MGHIRCPRLESCADIGILIDGKKCVQTRVKTAFNYKQFLKQIFSILRFLLIISIDFTFYLIERARCITSTQRAQTFFNIKYIFSTLKKISRRARDAIFYMDI